MERCAQDLSPGAVGWLGTTAGVTQDGTFIAVVRFDCEGAARASSDRPEQDQWWAETYTLLDGEVTIRDGVRTELYRVGELNVPPELGRRDDEARELLVGPIEFLDLREPWLYAAR
jgi:hypothetical protein